MLGFFRFFFLKSLKTINLTPAGMNSILNIGYQRVNRLYDLKDAAMLNLTIIFTNTKHF